LCDFVRTCAALATPFKPPNWIHISFGRSEIGSDWRISEEPKSLVAQLPRLSHDDFAPMFTSHRARNTMVNPSLNDGAIANPQKDDGEIFLLKKAVTKPDKPIYRRCSRGSKRHCA